MAEIANFAPQMTKIGKIIGFSLLLVLWTIPLAAQRKGYVISPRNGESALSEASVRETVRQLTDPEAGGRATGTEGGKKAAFWLESQFRKAGLQPLGGAYLHAFQTDKGLPGRNVIGLVPGAGPASRFILVMAHFDNLGILDGTLYPGADSNASGVAALLEVGRMFVRMNACGKSYADGIILVALDGKEQSLSGAGHLLRSLQEGHLTLPGGDRTLGPDDIRLVVNLDQMGSTLAPLTKGNPQYLMMLSEAASGRRESALAVNKAQGLDLELAWDYYGSKDFTKLFYRRISDQRPFLEAGIPAVMFTSGITMNNNKPWDDADSLDYPVLMRRIRLVFYYLERIR